MKVSSYTLGCKVNIYETEAVMNDFLDHGYIITDFDDVSDVYIINTCTVTSTSDSKSRKIIRQATRRNPNAVIAVMGCYSQLKPDEVLGIEGVDIIIGTDKRHQLYDLVEETLKTKRQQVLVDRIFDVEVFEELKVKRFFSHTRGFIKIQDGCENFCSYCTIPFARGKVRSRSKESIIAEISNLVDHGVKEIILSGINTGAYGQDLHNYSLSELLKDMITSIPGLRRIRISSIELMEVSDELLNTIHQYINHFAYHLHIPLQGGSDVTLKRMNRKYKTLDYSNKLKQIRSMFPQIAITTDCLAGFVGETDQDFEDAYRFIEEMQFAEMHIFPYSRRKGTAADHMEGHLNDQTRNNRAHRLIELSKKMAQMYRQQFIGHEIEVLVESMKNGQWFGRSSNYIEVTFPATDELENKIVFVKLIDANYPVAKGELVRKED
jgi:threonylcarbamoyladenosine tRNA methylthiotransferase MtaB